ncbi:HYR domain-containing protein [Pyxidicoccus fallax]|uniref:HYR domain-containing protein n=1 Tax=Pyxidicoccus fallax TaxID=394095 RepID=A0A848LZL3_9BACT|nr:FG-GAP-like repeat-containing protein [Pyxidicoccus fallax]NMO22763.1 HYR domain-containing protein [Pyxidicoccus fallax]NPC81179.1 HYR domain-containing protein [Pyxidicoccus fallax]
MSLFQERECTCLRLPGLRLSALALLALTACGETGHSEQSGADTLGHSELEANGECQVQPPFNPNFEPELEWAWTGSPVMPSHNQVMMTPIVVEVNGDGVPDIVFSTFAGGNYTTNGVLRAISGANGSDLWAVTDPTLRVRPAASVAGADIDGDGLVELCAIPEDGAGILCFENTGAFKFRTAGAANNWGGVAFADLEGDGSVEIINGNHVFSNTGALKWVGLDGMGGIIGPLSFAADIDGDGLQEVVNDRAIYRHDGTLKCLNTSIGHGLAGVANFDGDPRGEVVVVWSGRVSLMDDDCTLLWTQSIPGGGNGGAPNIADFDADGQPEIGVAGAARYAVFETNGTVKWSSATQDNSSNVTGSSTFDFEGDGRAEVVYGDEVQLRVYDGATGAVRFSVPHASGTTYENPLIVDVDGDDNAEIVVASNNYAFSGPTGIRVFRDRKDGWVNTRRIWNQHAYSVTHVNDNGTIPAHPVANWRTPGLNTFRANSQGTGVTSPYAAADMTVTEVSSTCDRTTGVLGLNARVYNQGDAAVSSGMRVAFYQGNPATGGTLLGVATLSSVLPAGSGAVVTLTLASPPGGTAEVWAVADDDGTGTGRETECVETNNGRGAPVSLACSTNVPPVAVCRNVTVNAAAATCSAPASVNDGSHDPDNQPGPLSITQSPAGPFSAGTHAVTLTVSDGQASDSCTATVTVVDVTAPVITCPAERIVDATGPEGAFVTPGAATVSDACGAEVSGPSAGIYPLGTTAVTYTATDAAGNSASCTTAIHVVDREATPPKLTMCDMPRYTSATQVKACGWATASPGGAAIGTVLLTIDGGAPQRLTPDSSGGFVLSWLSLAEGHHTITLTAISTDGGITTESREVTVDRTAPIVRVLSPAPGSTQPPVVDVVSEVTDLTPVRVTVNWVSITHVDAGTNLATNPVTFSGFGYNTVLVQATDAAGNTSEQVFQVLVQ